MKYIFIVLGCVLLNITVLVFQYYVVTVDGNYLSRTCFIIDLIGFSVSLWCLYKVIVNEIKSRKRHKKIIVAARSKIQNGKEMNAAIEEAIKETTEK